MVSSTWLDATRTFAERISPLLTSLVHTQGRVEQTQGAAVRDS